MKIVLHSEVLLGMEQLLIAFVQRVEWAQELLKENCGERKALWCARRRIPLLGLDAPTPAREQGLQPYGAFTLFFRWRKKSVQKKAGGTATPEAARPASRYSQISAFRALPCPALVFAQACQSLTAYGSCAHWARAPSRPKLRPAGAERLDAPNKFGASNSGP